MTPIPGSGLFKAVFAAHLPKADLIPDPTVTGLPDLAPRTTDAGAADDSLFDASLFGDVRGAVEDLAVDTSTETLKSVKPPEDPERPESSDGDPIEPGWQPPGDPLGPADGTSLWKVDPFGDGTPLPGDPLDIGSALPELPDLPYLPGLVDASEALDGLGDVLS